MTSDRTPETDPLDDGMVLAHNPRLASQELGGKSVLLHYEGRKILGLNETGSQVWALIDGERTIGAIIETLVEQSDAPPEEVDVGVREFVRELYKRELVTVVEE